MYRPYVLDRNRSSQVLNVSSSIFRMFTSMESCMKSVDLLESQQQRTVQQQQKFEQKEWQYQTQQCVPYLRLMVHSNSSVQRRQWEEHGRTFVSLARNGHHLQQQYVRVNHNNNKLHKKCCRNNYNLSYSSGRFLSSYALVDHGAAYEAALQGLHGKQLKLAELEGKGKDDPPFDPFIEDEMEEDRELGRIVNYEKKNSFGKRGKSNKLSSDGVEGDSDDMSDRNEDDDGNDDDNEEDEEMDWRNIYNNDGSLKRTKSEKAVLAAGSPAGGLFAVIELAGSQHKVTTDDVLIVNRLKPMTKFSVGSIHTLTDVLLVGSSHYTLVGMPLVSMAQVDVLVEEITQDSKIVVFSKRRRKNSKRRNGFRRDVTMLRILDIRPPPVHEDRYFNDRPEPLMMLDNNAAVAA